MNIYTLLKNIVYSNCTFNSIEILLPQITKQLKYFRYCILFVILYSCIEIVLKILL